MKIPAFFTCCLLALVVSAQELQWDFSDYYGRVRFQLGTAPQPGTSETSIRIDSSLHRVFPKPAFDYFQLPGLDPEVRPVRYSLKTTTNRADRTQKQAALPIDTNYRSTRMTGNRLLALGNVQLRAAQAARVEWLEMDLSYGRVVDLERYKNLRFLTQCQIEMNPVYERGPYLPLAALSPLRQVSDPFFWNDLRSCHKLEAISLDRNSGELLFLDESLAPLIAAGKLRSLQMQLLPYMPVNFHDFGTLDHVSLNDLLLPEAVNLAIVMNGFGKDTTAGNWARFLVAAGERSVTIPENGTFATHYANGAALCTGAYKDRQPDGRWEFRYDNGQLCEERFYDNGRKTGKWLLLDPMGDTMTVFRYENNRLVYREDQREDNDHPCDNYEFSYGVIHTIRYRLDWKTDREVSISKQESSVVPLDSWQQLHRGDTLSFTQESWQFAHDEWEYSWIYTCNGERYTVERYRRGRIGETPYFARNVEKSPSIGGESGHTYLYNRMTETTIDLLEQVATEREYSDDNPEKSMRFLGERSQRPSVEEKEE